MELALFTILAGFTLVTSVGVVATRNIVYAALLLLAALLGVAGLFVLLLAEFLALVQVFLYGGAIIIVILFALMLTRTGEWQAASENRRAPVAAVASTMLFGLLVFAFTSDAATFNRTERGGIPMADLGRVLFEEWAIPFEIASIVLLVALVGAVVLARTADNGAAEDTPLLTEPAVPTDPPLPPAEQAEESPAQTGDGRRRVRQAVRSGRGGGREGVE